MMEMLNNISFFDRDVIGKKPNKIGAKFKAEFFGKICSFRVKEIHSNEKGNFYIASLMGI